jgi:hypothetical protein
LDYHSVGEIVYLPLTFLMINVAATTILLFSVCFLFLVSFFLAGGEVAFFSLTSKDLNLLKTRKQPSFQRILGLLEQPKILLASMLIANSFVNIGIILISDLLINEWLAYYQVGFWLAFLIKVVSVTFLLVLFAEVLPKVWATHHKVWFASTSSLIIEIFNRIFFRLSKRFVHLSDNIERSVASSKLSALDNSDLDDAIDLLPENEATVEEKKILKGIRKFGDTTVKQIMRTRLDVSGIAANEPFEDIVRQVKELNYSRLPVYKNNLDEILGTLHTKDLLTHIHQSPGFDWHPLIRPPYFVHEQKLIEDLMQEFRTKRVHFAIVVDEFGGTSGIVTMEDIIEEIIGDIKDEFDDEEIGYRKIDEFNYIFEGKTMINDVCKAINMSIDTFDALRGESDSLAGLILEIAGEFPQVNESLITDHFTFVPLEINKNRIDKIKLVIHPPMPVE